MFVMLYNICHNMLYNIKYVVLYNICHVIEQNKTENVMLYNMFMLYVTGFICTLGIQLTFCECVKRKRRA